VGRENNKDLYESDIYWVSTQSIFKPYPFNIPVKLELPYDESFSLQLPKDMFKDVDDANLIYQVALTGNSKLPGWLKFDPDSFMLTGICKDADVETITISAMDGYKNKTTVEIPVMFEGEL
jgi:hypothetical protein